ncbi:Rid family detoxifying hydrolase [Vagococcus fessus]|uniref:Reactive intermediate/imine deaminase n=1 Tax=Vagococcus fessus TaxID=120370 RepID=A0A430A7U3_9ENTE|nr:Rid family detoxifying hydrolase [Vagococcus fessus]RSU03134.1 hypothetical protein CBF31_05290 [Vagococcus fessus]
MGKIPAAIGPYSVYREVGDLVFVSGQLPVDGMTGEFPSDKFEDQIKQVMENMALILNEVGASFDQVVKTTCFLKDLNDFAVFNEVYGSYFGTEFPARSAFQVAKLPKDALVEIEFIIDKKA